MPKLSVKGLPDSDNGRLLVRLNKKYRGGIERYGVASITNHANGKSLIVLLLGHENEDAIFMPYDLRTQLEVDKGGEVDFSIQEVGCLGKLRWYVGSPDPAVSIPAWIAVAGLALAVAGLIIAVIPLICK